MLRNLKSLFVMEIKVICLSLQQIFFQHCLWTIKSSLVGAGIDFFSKTESGR